MTDALLEIGCEELPVSYIEPAANQMADLAARYLVENLLAYETIETGATPRRLMLLITGLPETSATKKELIPGPPERMFKDQAGAYSPAALGFSRKTGVAVDKLIIKDGKICAETVFGGEKAKRILTRLFPQIIQALRFPKTMVWEDTGFRFARPIRTLVCLWGSEIIRGEIAGVKSGNKTYGLHAISEKKIEISNAANYYKTLAAQCIRVKPGDRKEYIAKLMHDALGKSKGQPRPDDALLSENTYLVETPSVVCGSFDEKYLKLPAEVLITCMRAKQKFFAVQDKEGAFLPSFVGIRNGHSENQQLVRDGYERVLTARLEDARFFVAQDAKISFEVWRQKLAGVIFHEKLGNMLDKTNRIEVLCGAVCDALRLSDQQKQNAKRAAALCKTDLVTSLVYEYPELQGIAGSIYARQRGENEEICVSIADHYKPAGPGDSIPRDLVSAVLALSDKIDSLTHYFIAGVRPSGNTDPYGLRRLAYGIIRIIVSNEMAIALKPLIGSLVAADPEMQKLPNSARAADETLDFIRQRFIVYGESTGLIYDEVAAVAESVWHGRVSGIDLTDALVRMKAVHEVRRQNEFNALAEAYKRADNIIHQATEKHMAIADEVSPALFTDQAEQTLFDVFLDIGTKIPVGNQPNCAALTQVDYQAILNHMVSLRKPLDDFFVAVMVMTDDEKVRANRLSLLRNITGLFYDIADFSKIGVTR